MRGAIPPLLHYAFMAWFSVKAQGQLYLSLCGPSKRWFPTTRLQGVTTQKTRNSIFNAVQNLRPFMYNWRDKCTMKYKRMGE
jgi:hypothetical protein